MRKELGTQILFQIWFVEDQQIARHGRAALTIWDTFAEAGGFYEFVAVFAYLIVRHYQNFNFIRKISQELYFSKSLEKGAQMNSFTRLIKG